MLLGVMPSAGMEAAAARQGASATVVVVSAASDAQVLSKSVMGMAVNVVGIGSKA